MISFSWVVLSYSNVSKIEVDLPYCYVFKLFYNVHVALYIAWEGELLEMDYEDKIFPVSQ